MSGDLLSLLQATFLLCLRAESRKDQITFSGFLITSPGVIKEKNNRRTADNPRELKSLPDKEGGKKERKGEGREETFRMKNYGLSHVSLDNDITNCYKFNLASK